MYKDPNDCQEDKINANYIDFEANVECENSHYINILLEKYPNVFKLETLEDGSSVARILNEPEDTNDAYLDLYGPVRAMELEKELAEKGNKVTDLYNLEEFHIYLATDGITSVLLYDSKSPFDPNNIIDKGEENKRNNYNISRIQCNIFDYVNRVYGIDNFYKMLEIAENVNVYSQKEPKDKDQTVEQFKEYNRALIEYWEGEYPNTFKVSEEKGKKVLTLLKPNYNIYSGKTIWGFNNDLGIERNEERNLVNGIGKDNRILTISEDGLSYMGECNITGIRVLLSKGYNILNINYVLGEIEERNRMNLPRR